MQFEIPQGLPQPLLRLSEYYCRNGNSISRELILIWTWFDSLDFLPPVVIWWHPSTRVQNRRHQQNIHVKINWALVVHQMNVSSPKFICFQPRLWHLMTNKRQRLPNKKRPLAYTIFDLPYVIKVNLSHVTEVRHFYLQWVHVTLRANM